MKDSTTLQFMLFQLRGVFRMRRSEEEAAET
jgi:hypothetical protein